MSDLAERMKELGAQNDGAPFRPFAWYNELGDSLEIYLAAGQHLSERVDGLFTVFVDPDDSNRVLGFVIKSIKKHFGETGLREVAFATGRSRVDLLIHSAVAGYLSVYLQRQGAPAPADPSRRERIEQILENAGSTEVEVDEDSLAALCA